MRDISVWTLVPWGAIASYPRGYGGYVGYRVYNVGLHPMCVGLCLTSMNNESFVSMLLLLLEQGNTAHRPEVWATFAATHSIQGAG